MMGLFSDTKSASAVRTILQMGGAILVTYGYMTAPELQTAMTQITTVLGGLGALGGLFALGKAKFGF